VIGVWALATCYGDVDDSDRVTVLAHTSRGLREIAVPYLVFGEDIPVPAPPAPRVRWLTLQPAIMEGTADA